MSFQELRSKCQEFATALLDHTRSSSELEILLNHDPTGPVFQHGERMHLNRLKLAIKYRQKKVRKWKNTYLIGIAFLGLILVSHVLLSFWKNHNKYHA